MRCPKCNTENENEAKFCVNCGSPLKNLPIKPKKQLMTRKQLIFTIIAVIAIVSTGIAIHYSNVLLTEPRLVGHDFQAITMEVPDSSNFVLETQLTQNVENGLIGFLNKGDYCERISGVMISSAKTPSTFGTVIEENGNMIVTTNTSDPDHAYNLYIQEPDCQIIIIGKDLNLMKKLAETIEIKDVGIVQPRTVQVNI